MGTKRQDVETQLKHFIKTSGMTCYRLSKISGVEPAQLSYFMNGHRSLSLPAVVKLCRALNLELRKMED